MGNRDGAVDDALGHVRGHQLPRKMRGQAGAMGRRYKVHKRRVEREREIRNTMREDYVQGSAQLALIMAISLRASLLPPSSISRAACSVSRLRCEQDNHQQERTELEVHRV